MSFPNDDSVQLSYSSFPFTPTLLDDFTTSNYVSNISNLLINNINTKQNILTAATNLLGIGSSITDIDYTKITLNKPTNFQADWNTTIINKPSTFPADMTDIYNKTETNNLLNAKQNTLTAATTLLGTGGSITGINFNTVINKPTYNTPLSSNVSTNVISVDLSSYATNTALTNGLAAKQDTLTAATTLLGTGGSITGINFNTVINKPTYNTPLSSNVSTNVISVDLSSKQDTLTAATNLLGIGSAITGINFNTITNKPTYTSPLSSNVSTNVISVDLSSKQNTLTASTVLAGIGSNLTLINYATLSNLPTTFPANMTDIYTKTETNNLLNAKEAILTFSSPIIRTVNTISLNQSLIDFNNLTNKPDMNLYLLKSGGAMTGNLGIGTTNNANSTLELYSTTQLSSRIILSGKEFYDNVGISSGGIAILCGVNRTGNRQLWIGDSLNLTQNTTNQILRLMPGGIDCIATNGTTSLPIFLGGGAATTTINGSTITLNGTINNNLANPVITISATNENQNTTLFLGTPHQNTGAYKTAIIAEGISNWSRSRLHFCLNDVADNTRPAQNAGLNNIRMTILPNGNVGIGNSRPDQLLDVNGSAIIRGNLTIQDGFAINFGASGTDGRIYRTGGQVYIEADDIIYFRSTVANNNITFNQGSVSIPGSLSGGNNVCKRSSFTFTPTLVNVIGIGLRYTQTINLSNYMNSVDYGSGVQYTFRIHIWTSTGDYYDSINNVESIGFYVHLSRFGVDGKIRINTIYNNSNGSTIGFNSFDSIFYNGWNGNGGASTKVCVIENISSF